MRLYAFAALLAFPFFGLGPEAAKADYYCCGAREKPHHSSSHHFRVIKDAVIFGCDGYHCETNVTLYSDISIKARCRNGWCEIQSLPLKDAWVLESCLEKDGYGHSERKGYSGHESYKDYGPDEAEEPYRGGHAYRRKY